MSARGGSGPPVEGGRLHPWQMMVLLITIPAIEDSTVIDHWLARRVGADEWLSILLAVPVICVGVLLLFALADRHPDRDLAGMLQRLVGPLAYPLGIVYVTLFLADATLSLRQFGTLARLLSFMNLTPYAVFAAGLMLVVCYGCWLGIEVLARVNTAVFVFVDLPLGVLLTLLSVNHQKLSRLLPILAHGLTPVMWGSWLVIGKFGELVLLLVFLPLVAERRPQARGIALKAVLLVTVIALGHSMGAALTFGPFVSTIQWPSYAQVRSIVIARFIANLDWVAVILWVHGYLVEISTFLYAVALTLARLFGARSHRPFVPILGAAVLAGSFFVGVTQTAMFHQRWLLDAYGFVAVGWVIPILLLGVSLVRGDDVRPAALTRARRQIRPGGRGTPRRRVVLVPTGAGTGAQGPAEMRNRTRLGEESR